MASDVARLGAEVQGTQRRIDDLTDRTEQGLAAVHHRIDDVTSPLVQRIDATDTRLTQKIDAATAALT